MVGDIKLDPWTLAAQVNAGLPAHELDTLVTKWKHQGYRQDIHSEDDNAEPLGPRVFLGWQVARGSTKDAIWGKHFLRRVNLFMCMCYMCCLVVFVFSNW